MSEHQNPNSNDEGGSCGNGRALLSRFLSLLSTIYRILLTLYSVYPLIIFTTWMVEVFLVLCVMYHPNAASVIIISIIYFIFAGFVANFATISLWEFFKFSFLRKNNPFNTVFYLADKYFNLNIYQYEDSNKQIEDNDPKIPQRIFDFISFILCLLIIIGVILAGTGSNYSLLDTMNCITICIPFAYYSLLLIFYWLHCCKSLKYIFKCCSPGNQEQLNDIENEKDPFIYSLKQRQQEGYNTAYTYVKIAFMIINIILIIIASVKNKDFLGALTLIAFTFLMCIPILTLEMPFFVFNKIFGWLSCSHNNKAEISSDGGQADQIDQIDQNDLNNTKANTQKEDKKSCDCCYCIPICINHSIEHVDSFKNNNKFRMFPRISGFIYILLLGIVFAIFYLGVKTDSEVENPEINIRNEIKMNGNLTRSLNAEGDNRKFVRPPMCYTQIHHLSVLQLMALAVDSYTNKGDSDMHAFKVTFFTDSDVTVESAGRIVDTKIKMMKYNINIASSNTNLMVYSIRGSSTCYDWWLDIQFFCASAMFTLCRQINPLVSRIDSWSYTLLANLITSPERLLNKMSLINEYVNDLSKGFEANRAPEGYNEMFVGHSLGGGLSKVMARKYHLSSLSLSGPGVSAFTGMFKKREYNENFAMNFIDVIPDMDLVPRVEKSGGTEYRILCDEGAAKCHSGMTSLCMGSLMCGIDASILCRNQVGVERYDHMMDFVETIQ